MVSSIRNTTVPVAAAPLISGNPALLCNSGQDYGLEYIFHIFSAGEIGTGAGQTRDTTSNPTTGFLFAQFQGSQVKQIMSAFVKKTVLGANAATAFRSFAWATVTPHIYNVSFRIVNSDASDSALPGYNPNYSSIYMLDRAMLLRKSLMATRLLF
jgi:hypothetical protein